MNNSGPYFTWSTKGINSPGRASRLDRCLVNPEWIIAFPLADLHVDLPRVSDHNPLILSLGDKVASRPKQFKFFNVWTDHDLFLDTVRRVWSMRVTGTLMFVLFQKQKALKKELRKFNVAHFSNLPEKVGVTRKRLTVIQEQLLTSISDRLRVEEKRLIEELDKVSREEEAIVRQKSRMLWLREGDSNLAYFHKCVRWRFTRNKIMRLVLENGTVVDDFELIRNEFLDAYRGILGTPNEHFDFSVDDIKIPDGFSALFYKKAWSVVGKDVMKAVKSFFHHGRMLKECNTTIIALVPNVKNPSCVDDYRPISCYNIIYKCVSKLLPNRIKKVLENVISESQAAFIPGRSIATNILLGQELIRGYSRNQCSPRCAIKIDIRKAYDSVNWWLVVKILEAINLPPKFIGWIKACISTTSFSIALNRSLEGYFHGAKGLRQGDPLSSYLFVLVMEVFSCLLNKASRRRDFVFHPKCVKGKSLIYFGGCRENVKEELVKILNFKVGTPPFTYLGIPLAPCRLNKSSYKPFVDKMSSRIDHWTLKFLSFAGRLILVKSVLVSIQSYWFSIIVFPKCVIKDMESKCMRFLWKGKNESAQGAKVNWDVVCQTTKEGGLGIRRLQDSNLVAQLKL